MKVTIIIGPQGCGKSTLAKKMTEGKNAQWIGANSKIEKEATTLVFDESNIDEVRRFLVKEVIIMSNNFKKSDFDGYDNVSIIQM